MKPLVNLPATSMDFLFRPQSQEITQSGNMGRKQRPILSVQQKTKAMQATTYAILFLI